VALRSLPALIVSLAMLLEPILGFGFSVALGVGDVPGKFTWIGGAILLVGLALVVVSTSRREAAEEAAAAAAAETEAEAGAGAEGGEGPGGLAKGEGSRLGINAAEGDAGANETTPLVRK
jgi:hypothetical protein